MGILRRLPDALERAEVLDAPAYRLANAVSTALQLGGRMSRPLQDALHGVWLGHPLHPALATFPIGCWTLAFGLDTAASIGVTRDRRMEQAADIALAAGSAGAVAAAASGLADWRQIHGKDRRTGVAHAAINTTALGLTLGSMALRRRGRRAEGRALSGAGWLAIMAGAYLGGHMVYRRRIGVDHAGRSPEPRRFHPVVSLDRLAEDRPHRVEVWDEEARAAVGLVLVRHRGRVHAMGARCSHFGGPLDEGWVQDGGLVCPWHGSRFCMKTGRVLGGPATAPQPRYRARVRADVVEVARVPEPGDEAVTPGAVRSARAAPPASPPPAARKADEVLFEHHQLLRGLFEEIRSLDREDPERRDLLRLLANELEIHEHIEDEIFYPAVRPVSEDVPVAHAEHQQLADMLAATLRLNTATSEFDEHLRTLHEAVDHHASSEELSMFREAQRLGDDRLRDLGAQLEALLEEERESRARQVYRRLKIRILERVP